ncbi:MAG: hypothetical protein HZB30_05940 [Nitrospirae bacterium]|nr:hypothetical protein [Nitrospirota bacterium]
MRKTKPRYVDKKLKGFSIKSGNKSTAWDRSKPRYATEAIIGMPMKTRRLKKLIIITIILRNTSW